MAEGTLKKIEMRNMKCYCGSMFYHQLPKCHLEKILSEIFLFFPLQP
jgi:hypothetical protein